MLSALSNLGGTLGGLFGSAVDPQKIPKKVADAITDSSNGQALVRNAELNARAMEDSTKTTARKLLVEAYNASKRITEAITF
jgi:hypothetical protein